jgi:hypothetical protein
MTWSQKSFKYWRRKPKYKNAVTTVNGIKYDSKFESKVGQDLEIQKKAGEIKDFDRQIPVDLYVNGIKITRYIVDFRVEHNDGTIEWIEAKGFPTPEWKLKARIFEATVIEKSNGKERYTVMTR